MYSTVQTFIDHDLSNHYSDLYLSVKEMLFHLLDSPVQYTQHIGGTKHFNYPTEPILDILVGVKNLHDITALDEKRLNYIGYYRLHHNYHKKVIMAKFNNLQELKQHVRLHILQLETPLFAQYQSIDHLLATNNEAINYFKIQKQTVKKDDLTIREYENHKEQLFTTLAQRYL